METYSFDFDPEDSIRSSFLTILCILTFIGSGWAILSSVWTYSNASRSSSLISKNVKSKSDPTQIGDSVDLDSANSKHSPFQLKIKATLSKMFTIENIRKTAIGSFISALLTLLGALLMWRLYRKGFYLYIAGVLIGILFPLMLYGNNLIAIGISSFSSFFGLVFIALYSLNLKSMK